MAALPANYREVVQLFHVEQLSYKEIASTLGVPLGTVMTWLHRARAKLQEPAREDRRLAMIDHRHLTDDEAQLHLESGLSAPEAARVETHLAGCPSCQALVSSFEALSEALTSMPVAELPADFTAIVMARIDERELARAASAGPPWPSSGRWPSRWWWRWRSPARPPGPPRSRRSPPGR